ncbi:hypothetical protein JTE90_024877 [Oedothorax gibbosus]|uniref:Hsp70-binding protein 1 n=1 Tax=Oedothorax gibbosus TaxID=931172 RepID=A0AAV6V2Y1_9ARAC|nr:hypothetical protein JTE90_024877 [Oedothorax gibbosus]
MQVCCVDPQPTFILPPSDIDKMKAQLALIDKFMNDIEKGEATSITFDDITNAVTVIDGIILSLDNSNDFFKIGGFKRLVPLLNCPNAEVVATTAELIADLCQNNTFCQTKALELGILSELVKQLANPIDPKVRLKSLYALSCLCRHNEESIKCLSESNAVQVLLQILHEPDEKLRTKTAFFITHLSEHENFREAFYSTDLVPTLIKLLSSEQDSSSEYLLSALENQVSRHLQSRVQSSSDEYNLLEILRTKVKLYNSEEEFQESTEYCKKLLALCFPDAKLDS